MSKKPFILTLAVPVLGLAIYTIFHYCQREKCFFCRYNSSAITFACGCAAAGLLAWYLKE